MNYCFIYPASIAYSQSSESEAEEPTEDTNQEKEAKSKDVKSKKNVNEFVDDGDDRYILHVAIYPRYNLFILLHYLFVYLYFWSLIWI